MQKRWMNQAILALVLAVVGSVAYWYEYSVKPEKEEAEEAKKKLVNLKETAVDTLRVVAGDKVFAFKCLGGEDECKPGGQGEWEMTEPKKLTADKSHVGSLLSTLNNTTSSEDIDLSTDTPEKRKEMLKSQYGLGEDAIKQAGARRFELNTKDKKSFVIYLGETSPIGEKIFTLVSENGAANESRVYLMPSYYKSNLEKDLNYWRDKKIFTFNASEISAFDLTVPAKKVNIHGQKSEGRWTLQDLASSGKFEYPGDIDLVDNLVRGAANLSAESFLSDDKSDATAKTALKGSKELATLTLTRTLPEEPEEKDKKATAAPKSEVFTLNLFQKDKKTYATTSLFSSLVELDSNAEKKFDKTLNDLRVSKLITSVERFSAKKLVFEGTALPSAIVLSNVNSKWHLEDRKEAKVDQDKVTKLLDKLSNNKIKDFLSGASVPTGEDGGIVLTLGDDKAPDLRKIVFWKDKEDLYARDLKAPTKEALKLEKNLKEILPWDKDFFLAGQKKEKPKKKGA